MNISKVKEAFQTIATICKELEDTVLLGWPHERYPDPKQAQTIVVIYHELSIQAHTCDISESDRWYLAGQIVARVERDVKE